MAVPQGPVLAAVLLFVSWSLPFSSSSPACPQPCTCQRAPLLNCSSSGLSSVPQLIQDSFTELDLSHNLLSSVRLQQPHRNLRNVRLGNNRITQLSLCVGRSPEGRYLRGRHRLKPWSRRGCVSWAPTLQLLSVERNQLEKLPDGLEGVESLQVLQLSFNRISTLQPGDLNGLRLLKELDLKHNLISSLHPQMFQDLVQLRVLDLSFNMLTSLHPLMHLTLLNIGSDVRLEGNKWQCDCTMRSIRRRMAYDSSRGLQAWSMVCASPSILSGRDLLQLEDDDLNCVGTENSPELHQDVTVYSGSKILLSCSAQDPMWWTPNGQAFVSQTDLLIRDITERDAGLYVCVSEEQQVVSIYNLQISKLRGGGRKPRSLPRTIRQIVPNKAGEERNQRATQSDLTLAVCLSVFITFLIAFILGVLARPCIDVLWKKVTKKKTSPATNSVPSVEQRQYDNEAFSNSEEPEEIGTCRERRVTFSTIEYRNDRNVQYYDTEASGNQESTNMADIERQAAEAWKSRNTDGDSGSDNSSKQISPEDEQDDGRDLSADCRTGHTHNMEFEHIPDPVELEERGSLSSSLSEKALKEDQLIQRDHTGPKSPQLVKDSVQQTADFSTSNPIRGFTSKPFADWSPHTETRNPTDPDLLEENGELFEFSDSVRSSSARSSTVFGSFNDPKRTVSYISHKQKMDDTSSSSSYMSEDEPTQYTVNSDQDINRDVSFELQIHSGDLERLSAESNQGDYRGDTKRPVVRPDHSSSSESSDSDAETVQCTIKQDTDNEEKEKSIREYYESSRIVTAEKETREKFTPKPQTKWRGVSLVVATHGKSLDTNATSPPAAYSSSCSSESDAEITNLKVEHIHYRKGQIKKQLDINASLPYSDSSSSDERMDDTTKHTNKQENREVVMAGLDPDAGWPAVDLQHIPRIKRRLDIKAPSPASYSLTSSDSDDETTKHTKKKEQQGLHMSIFPSKVSQTVTQEPNAGWPTLDLQRIPRINRRLDIKSPASDSSSSRDNEDETTKYIKKQELEELHMSRLPSKVSPTVSLEPETRSPTLKLRQTPHIKRRLDIKASSPPSDSSSSSDSEDDTTKCTNKQEEEELHMSRLPNKTSPTVSQEQDRGWPAIDLQRIPRIKRRLDIKAPTPASDSPWNSDDEPKKDMKKNEQEELHMSRPPIKVSPTISHDPEQRWSLLDLEHTTRIKRRLDIKAPTPASHSSSSSDSDDDTTKHIKKQQHEESRRLSKVSRTVSQEQDAGWPTLDLQRIPQIKRRLDIKAPSPASGSSSSSDRRCHTVGQRPGKLDTGVLPFQESQRVSQDPDTKWPAVDLQHIPQIKRRLDIKAPTPASHSSSSSDSDDDTTKHIKKQQHEESRRLSKVSRTVSQEQDAGWPTLDLQRIPQIKRRLDIKAPSPASGSSSSSDRRCHTVGQRPGKLDTGVLPFQESQRVSQDPDTKWPAVDLQHIPQIKRRLDIKAPTPASHSSSSSDSDDDTTKHIKKQQHEESRRLSKVSQTVSQEQDAGWPTLDLQRIPQIKRRLDIKAPSPASHSSSSSDSDDDTTKHIKKQQHEESRRLSKVSRTVSQEQDAGWPTLDLQRIPQIKRRLDIKAPSPASGSSSSSDSEDETTKHIKKNEQEELHMSRPPIKVSPTISHDPEQRWSLLDLEHTTRIKRRLDIKAPTPASHSSSSSDSEGEATDHTVGQRPGKLDTGVLPFQESQRVSQDPDTKWPAVDLQHIPWIKRRLDIKAPSPASRTSCSSDSEDEMTNHTKGKWKGMTHTAKPPNTLLDTVKHDQETQWLTRDLQHVPHIKAPSLQPDRSVSSMSLGFRQSESNSSTSESEDEKRDHKTEVEMGLSTTSKASEKEFVRSPTARVINISHSPKTDHNVKLQKHAVVSDDLGNKPTNDNTYTMPEINSDLQSRWATMTLGISRSRRRFSSSTQEPPNLPSSPPPDSPSSSSDQSGTVRKTNRTIPRRRVVGMQEVISPESSLILENKPVNVAPTLKDRDDKSIHSLEVKERLRGNYSLSTTQEKSINLQLPDFSSSSSEDETDHRVPDLSLGIPRLKRSLDFKALSPEPSNSPSSESESENEVKEYTAKQSRHAPNKSGMIDIDSVITYNRMIIKASSPPGNSLSLSGKNQTVDYTKQRYTEAEIVAVAQEDEGDGNASLSPRRVPRMSFGDRVKKRMEQSSSNTEADLPPEIRWTGVGHRLADLSSSTPRRSLNAALTSLEQTPPAEPKLPSLNSPNSSSSTIDIRVKQDSCKSDVTLMHKYSSLSPNRASPASSGALDNSLSSTDETLRAVADIRREKKGLSALKAMSSERQRWDTNLDAGASPLFDDRSTQEHTSLSYHKSEADIKPLSKQPLTRLNLSSGSVGGRRTMELLYGVPLYTKHDIKEMEPLQEAPPPVPATPPPAEAEELTWRSPQSSKK